MMADDTVEQARQWLHWHGKAQYGDKGLRLRMEEAARLLRELLDSRLTVVKLRDDETSPVAAPCAIEGACQYGNLRAETDADAQRVMQQRDAFGNENFRLSLRIEQLEEQALAMPTDVKAELQAVIDREGGISQAARTLGVGRAAIHHIINGTFAIGDTVAAALGYRPVVRYEKLS